MDTNPKMSPQMALARPANEPQPAYKRCLNCGKAISPGQGGRRDYCNAACKQAAYRNRLLLRPSA